MSVPSSFTYRQFVEENGRMLANGEPNFIEKSKANMKKGLKNSDEFVKGFIEYHGVSNKKAKAYMKICSQFKSEFESNQKKLKKELRILNSLSALHAAQLGEFSKHEAPYPPSANDLFMATQMQYQHHEKKISELQKRQDEIKQTIIQKSAQLMESGTKFQGLAEIERTIKKAQLEEFWSMLLAHSEAT